MFRRVLVVSGDRAQQLITELEHIGHREGLARVVASARLERVRFLVVEGRRIRSRLISARETARLMGLKDSYILPRQYSDAYHLTGDGVAAPDSKSPFG